MQSERRGNIFLGQLAGSMEGAGEWFQTYNDDAVDKQVKKSAKVVENRSEQGVSPRSGNGQRSMVRQ